MPKPTANTVDTTTIENHIKLIAAILDRQKGKRRTQTTIYKCTKHSTMDNKRTCIYGTCMPMNFLMYYRIYMHKRQ